MASLSGAIIFLYKTCIFCKFVMINPLLVSPRKKVTNGYGFSVTIRLPEKDINNREQPHLLVLK